MFQVIVLMGVEISIFTSLNTSSQHSLNTVSRKKTQSKDDFSGRIELVEDFLDFIVNYASLTSLNTVSRKKNPEQR